MMHNHAMEKLRRLIWGAGAAMLLAARSGLPGATGAVASAAVDGASHLSRCHPATLAGSGGFLAGLKTVCQVASAAPGNGEVNPYGVAVVPESIGDPTAGDVLVSNLNDSKNLQGTGGTIMEISQSGQAGLFANLAARTGHRVGLTTALVGIPGGLRRGQPTH